jgi:transcriptional/translational regulatory protein YebC/TACO1
VSDKKDLLQALQESVDRARANQVPQKDIEAVLKEPARQELRELKAALDKAQRAGVSMDEIDEAVKQTKESRRKANYRNAVAAGAELFGGHLGTCDALFGHPYCTCGKET